MKKVLLILAAFLLTNVAAQAQWVLQPFTFTNTDLTPVYLDAVDANVAWAAGFDVLFNEGGNEVVHTANGGTTWTKNAIANLGATEEITGIVGLNATTALVCTSTGAGGRILKTVNSGTTWTVQTTATQFASAASFPNGIAFFNATEGVCFGDPGTGATRFEVYRTTDAGATWTGVPTISLPVIQAGEFGVVNHFAVNGNAIWFSSTTGRVFASLDKGVTWTVGNTNLGAVVPLISFRDASNGLALDDATGLLAATTNGGTTWSPVSYTGPLHVLGIHNVPGTNQFISVGAGTDAGSSYSRDNGATWTALESTFNHASVDVVSPTVAWSSAVDPNTATGLGANKLTSTALGTIKNVALQQGLSVYPNPSSGGQFVVTMAQGRATETQVEVLDMLGRAVYTRTVQTATAPSFNLDLSQQATGIYTMQLRTEGGVAQQKLVVK